MERRGSRQRQPQPRHSSLPTSLHRLLVLGPPSPPDIEIQDETEVASPSEPQANEPGPSGYRLQDDPDPVRSDAASGQPLPSFTWTPAVAEQRLGGVFEPSPPGQRSASQLSITRTVAGSEPEAVAGALPLPVAALEPPPYPTQQILTTDPIYYASSSTAPTPRPILPPGPRLRPISWSEESVVAGPSAPAARLGSPDRSALAPPRAHPHPVRSPLADARRSPPVAGPSRLPVAEEPQTSVRTRKTRTKKTHGASPSEGGFPPPEDAPTTARRRGAASEIVRGECKVSNVCAKHTRMC
ncbi:hypothetical protein PYCCODRAFT_591156 [Trametes coccinea BRFM310]|uniref:Uncharacterized protein n=1 Tax=Trametes coccinea (strain BRFM310) TaxID=1353009 RepID=A0A1Y2J332_TRAC3|nr:hypothetical protein PYCCODRAFT_591156 [Trametes coccinea BRFM310]